jgi:hypothetical protein
MKKKSIFLGIILLISLQKSFAQDTTNVSGMLTLKQCVDIALKNNIDINRSELDMQDSKSKSYTGTGQQVAFYKWLYQSWFKPGSCD